MILHQFLMDLKGDVFTRQHKKFAPVSYERISTLCVYVQVLCVPPVFSPSWVWVCCSWVGSAWLPVSFTEADTTSSSAQESSSSQQVSHHCECLCVSMCVVFPLRNLATMIVGHQNSVHETTLTNSQIQHFISHFFSFKYSTSHMPYILWPGERSLR